jgi:hypothetical protein
MAPGNRFPMGCIEKKERAMKKLLLAAAAAGALFAAAPANAQVYLGADPGGVGVQVGPFGVGVGPNWGYRHGWRDAYYQDCRTVRQRIVTPAGNVVYRSQRVCDCRAGHSSAGLRTSLLA